MNVHQWEISIICGEMESRKCFAPSRRVWEKRGRVKQKEKKEGERKKRWIKEQEKENKDKMHLIAGIPLFKNTNLSWLWDFRSILLPSGGLQRVIEETSLKTSLSNTLPGGTVWTQTAQKSNSHQDHPAHTRDNQIDKGQQKKYIQTEPWDYSTMKDQLSSQSKPCIFYPIWSAQGWL